MTCAYVKLRVDEPERGVIRVLINRPDKRNAIDFQVREELIQVFERVQSDSTIRAVVLGGVEGNFSAGGDLPSMLDLSEVDALARMQHIARLCRLVYCADLPVVTAMEGVSAGACIGLALLGDWIVAGEGTQVLMPFMKLGLVPDWGMLLTLPLRIGLPASRRLITAQAPVTATELSKMGFVDELVPDADVMASAIRHARYLASLPAEAFARIKLRLTHRSSTFDEELSREANDQALLLRSADFREGYSAFMEKRVPTFSQPRAKG